MTKFGPGDRVLLYGTVVSCDDYGINVKLDNGVVSSFSHVSLTAFAKPNAEITASFVMTSAGLFIESPSTFEEFKNEVFSTL